MPRNSFPLAGLPVGLPEHFDTFPVTIGLCATDVFCKG